MILVCISHHDIDDIVITLLLYYRLQVSSDNKRSARYVRLQHQDQEVGGIVYDPGRRAVQHIHISLVKLERQRAADIRNDQGIQLAYIYCLLQTSE